MSLFGRGVAEVKGAAETTPEPGAEGAAGRSAARAALRAVELRTGRPAWGVRSRTMYSIWRDSQRARFSSELPSSLTTRMSGWSLSSVGMKSITPLPALIKASLTDLMFFTIKRRSCSGNIGLRCLYSR